MGSSCGGESARQGCAQWKAMHGADARRAGTASPAQLSSEQLNSSFGGKGVVYPQNRNNVDLLPILGYLWNYVIHV